MNKVLLYRVAAFLTIALLWSACTYFHPEPTERMKGYTVHGIDVSHYQHRVDWDRVAEQEVSFAFVKATEGLEYKDSLFCHNWGTMKKAGIIRGAYHFYYPTLSAKKQAENFIETVDIQMGDLPPVLDFEVVKNKTKHEIVAGLKTWLSLVEKNYHIRPIIYTNQKLYHKYIKGHFDEHIVWIARYNKQQDPDMPIGQDWTFWQYGDRGQMDGIKGDVDFNVFQGDYAALKSLTLSPNDTLNEEKAIPYSL